MCNKSKSKFNAENHSWGDILNHSLAVATQVMKFVTLLCHLQEKLTDIFSSIQK